MADFCRECSIENFGEDTKDLTDDLLTVQEFNKGKVSCGLCEGCGGGYFAPDGTCQGGCMKPEHGNGDFMRHADGIGFMKVRQEGPSNG